MNKETVLEIEFMPVWDKWAWRIVKQDESVLPRWEFRDNVLGVYSKNTPDFTSEGVLYLRGDYVEDDRVVRLCSEEEKKAIEEKVKLINEEHGKTKRWICKFKEDYYFINSFGEIRTSTNLYDSIDDAKYEFGNYFQTEEQAEQALERVKKALQEEQI